MLAGLALGLAGCGDEGPDADLEEEEEMEEEENPQAVDLEAACEGTADSLVFLGSSDHAGQMDGLQHLAAYGDALYGCAEKSGMALWDVTNLAAPRLLRGDPAGPTATCSGLAVEPNTGRLALARADSVELYSLDEPTNPTLLGTTPVSGVVDLSFGDDGTLYGAAQTAGVVAFSIGGDQITEVARASDATSDARAVAAGSGMVVAAEGRAGARTYLLSGNSLVPSAPVGTGGTAVEVDVNGYTAYVATLKGVVQIDVADPGNPQLTSLTESVGTAMGVTTTDNAVWVADWTALRAFDQTAMAPAGDETLVSNPPSLLNRTAMVLEDEGRVFAAHWNGIRTYAPCATAAPAIRPHAERLEFNDVAEGDSKPQVLTLRNLGNQPLAISSISTDHAMFSVPEAGFQIPPGGAMPIEVTFAPTDSVPTYGNVIINSNDPDEPTRMVSVGGNIPRTPAGSQLEPFHDVDTNGGTWRPQDFDGDVAMLSYFAFW